MSHEIHARLQLEELVDEYEAALRSGQSPDIVAFVERAPEALRSSLLREALLAYQDYAEPAEVSAARMTGKSNPAKSQMERPDFNERENLCRRFALLLRGLLTEEQYDSLPGSERWMRRLDPVQKERKIPESPRDAGSGTKPKDPRNPGRGRGEQGRGSSGSDSMSM